MNPDREIDAAELYRAVRERAGVIVLVAALGALAGLTNAVVRSRATHLATARLVLVEVGGSEEQPRPRIPSDFLGALVHGERILQRVRDSLPSGTLESAPESGWRSWIQTLNRGALAVVLEVRGPASEPEASIAVLEAWVESLLGELPEMLSDVSRDGRPYDAPLDDARDEIGTLEKKRALVLEEHRARDLASSMRSRRELADARAELERARAEHRVTTLERFRDARADAPEPVSSDPELVSLVSIRAQLAELAQQGDPDGPADLDPPTTGVGLVGALHLKASDLEASLGRRYGSLPELTDYLTTLERLQLERVRSLSELLFRAKLEGDAIHERRKMEEQSLLEERALSTGPVDRELTQVRDLEDRLMRARNNVAMRDLGVEETSIRLVRDRQSSRTVGPYLGLQTAAGFIMGGLVGLLLTLLRLATVEASRSGEVSDGSGA